jgi:hypothetical protein
MEDVGQDQCRRRRFIRFRSAGGRRGAFIRRFPDVADKAKPLAREGPDQALLFAIVADRLAHRVDVACERRLGDDASGPDRIQKGILADDVLAVLHEVEQEIENLRADRHDLGIPGQLPPIRVERKVFEQVLHLRAPSPGSMALSVRPSP